MIEPSKIDYDQDKKIRRREYSRQYRLKNNEQCNLKKKNIATTIQRSVKKQREQEVLFIEPIIKKKQKRKTGDTERIKN